MNIQTRIRIASTLAVCGLLSTTAAWAGAPDGVVRCFGELTGVGDSCVDWEAEGSRRLVAHRDQDAQRTLEFITPGGAYGDNDAIVRDADGNVLLDLRSTVWVRTPVLHITDQGTQEVREIYWLLEDLDGDGELDGPGPGMTAPTGPDGAAAMFLTIRISQAPPTDFDNPNRFYLNPNGSVQLCIAIGSFAK